MITYFLKAGVLRQHMCPRQHCRNRISWFMKESWCLGRCLSMHVESQKFSLCLLHVYCGKKMVSLWPNGTPQCRSGVVSVQWPSPLLNLPAYFTLNTDCCESPSLPHRLHGVYSGKTHFKILQRKNK